MPHQAHQPSHIKWIRIECSIAHAEQFALFQGNSLVFFFVGCCGSNRISNSSINQLSKMCKMLKHFCDRWHVGQFLNVSHICCYHEYKECGEFPAKYSCRFYIKIKMLSYTSETSTYFMMANCLHTNKTLYTMKRPLHGGYMGWNGMNSNLWRIFLTYFYACRRICIDKSKSSVKCVSLCVCFALILASHKKSK